MKKGKCLAPDVGSGAARRSLAPQMRDARVAGWGANLW